MARTGFQKGAKMERWERALANPTRTLKQIGAMMVSESQLAFQTQALGRKKWPARGPINTMGIIADFAAGKDSPPNRRFQTTPALKDTGRLMASIAFQVERDSVVVGSNLPYAQVHHTGGPVESETITEEVQDLLRKWLKGDGAPHAGKLGFLLNKNMTGTKLPGTVPERPLVGITQQTRDDIREIIGVEIFEIR